MKLRLSAEPFSLVRLLYNYKVTEAKDKLKRKMENEIYVTDLVYCPLKYRYQREFVDIAIASSISPATLLGEFVHKGLEKLIQEVLGPAAMVAVEVERERDVVVDGVRYIVKGRVDMVVEDVVIEIKSGHGGLGIPLAHHVLQARLYLWLTGLPKAVLLYVTRNRLAEFVVSEPSTDGEVSDLIRSLVSGRPAPRYTWECRYCPYSMLCPQKRA